jgi:propanol-preferring alcohol dehydrogenase
VTPYRGVEEAAGRRQARAGAHGRRQRHRRLGAYAVQYARLFAGGSTVIALGRNDSKLAVAVDNGAHHGINARDKSVEAIRDELAKLTGRRTIDAILDYAGATASVSLGFDLLGVEGTLVSVGLMSDRVEHRLFPFVGTELSYLGSFWSNYNDLVEVLALADAGKIKHNVTKVRLENINEKPGDPRPRQCRRPPGHRLRLSTRHDVGKATRRWLGSGRRRVDGARQCPY